MFNRETTNGSNNAWNTVGRTVKDTIVVMPAKIHDVVMISLQHGVIARVDVKKTRDITLDGCGMRIRI